jgi:ABC-2 type transport system permease protein
VNAAATLAFSPRRVGAMVLRYWYLLRYSWPRVLDLIYWPTVQMLMWGFLQVYLTQAPGGSLPAGNPGLLIQAGSAFIGAVLLWDILFRGQIGFSISFLEEMWSRNLGNLMMTPLRPAELVASLMVMSIVRVLIGLVPVTLMAIAFFGFNFWGLGFAVAAFFLNLILTSWSIGLIASGLVLKKGMGAEGLAWSMTFLLLPLCCVYYPVATLPVWLQWIALALPPTHVFEGMRTLLLERTFDSSAMLTALVLNLAYFSAAAAAFGLLLRSARHSGSLMQTGE